MSHGLHRTIRCCQRGGPGHFTGVCRQPAGAQRTNTAAAVSVLRYTSYLLLAIGLLGVCLVAAGWLGFVAWPIVMIVWVRAAVHYRATQKRNLFSALAVAIKKQMPLGPMALAFANEQERGFASRARALAEKFQQGIPVGEVLRTSRSMLPREAPLAAAIGLESGDLSGALEATTYGSLFDRTWLQPTISRLLYLLTFVAIFLSFLTFMQLKVMPSWARILQDFGITNAPLPTVAPPTDPPVPQALLNWLAFWLPPSIGSTVIAATWTTMLIFISIATITALLVYGWLQWRGTLRPRLPYLRRIIQWVDMGPVLRMLALATRHNRPLNGTLVAVARLHPKRSVRGQVRGVVRDLDNGMPWQDSLRRWDLISAADAAVLAAATRSGNLNWALVEMADSFERKATYRLQALVQVCVPLLLLPLALATAVVAITYFRPMAILIENLA